MSHSYFGTCLPFLPVQRDTSNGRLPSVDVQPVDPLDLWTSPPFEPTVSRTGKGQEYFRGRGVSDDKGGLLATRSCETLSWSTIRASAHVPAKFFMTIESERLRVTGVPAIKLQAVEAYLKGKKALPVNVKFLIEGQEEIGSPNLAELLVEHKELLAADMALSADGGQISEKQVPHKIFLTSAQLFH